MNKQYQDRQYTPFYKGKIVKPKNGSWVLPLNIASRLGRSAITRVSVNALWHLDWSTRPKWVSLTGVVAGFLQPVTGCPGYGSDFGDSIEL